MASPELCKVGLNCGQRAWRPVSAIAVTLSISMLAYIALPYCLGARAGDRSLVLSLFEQGLIVVLVLIAASKAGAAADVLGLKPTRDFSTWTSGIVVVLVLAFSILLARHKLGVLSGLTYTASDGMPLMQAVLIGFAFVVAAPFAEEALFRGFLLPALVESPLGFWGGASLSSALWANMHLLNVGYGLLSIAFIFLGGLGLSYLRQRTGTLWPCILVHGCYNTFPAALILSVTG